MIAALLLSIACVASAAPRITTIEPAFALTTRGTYVHISGSDLLALPLGCPFPECFRTVRFGDADASLISNLGPGGDELTVIAPPHAAGTVDVTVNIPGKGSVTIPGGFRYVAVDDKDSEHVLLPVVVGGPGAYGSQWKADLLLHNASDSPVRVDVPICNPAIVAVCPPPVWSAHTTYHVTPFVARGAQGVYVRVPRNASDSIDLQLRVQDTSRQSETWGTSLPVVRETDFRKIVRMHGIPTDGRFRDTLRIYGFEGSATTTMEVRVVDDATNAVLATMTIDAAPPQEDPNAQPFAMIGSLRDALPQIATAETVSVEVQSLFVPPPPLWAFVTVTNNETQHVTIVAPRETQ